MNMNSYKKLGKSLVIILSLYVVGFNVFADKIYSCKSASGKMVFQDKPCSKTSEQISSKTINSKNSSAATINKAICRKSIENIHKYLVPEMVKLLTSEKREELVQKNIAQCMKEHTENDYEEILCFSRANSTHAASLCVSAPK